MGMTNLLSRWVRLAFAKDRGLPGLDRANNDSVRRLPVVTAEETPAPRRGDVVVAIPVGEDARGLPGRMRKRLPFSTLKSPPASTDKTISPVVPSQASWPVIGVVWVCRPPAAFACRREPIADRGWRPRGGGLSFPLPGSMMPPRLSWIMTWRGSPG